MKKFLFAMLLFGFLSAEESGTFIGLGFAGGFNASGHVKQHKTVLGRMEGNGFDAEFIFGYKQFFAQNIGLRYYLNVDYSPNVELKSDNPISLTTAGNFPQDLKNSLSKNLSSHKADIFNIGFNIDLLFNFIVSDNIDVGLYGGAQAGFNTWGGALINDLKRLFDVLTQPGGNFDVKVANIAFSSYVNLGVRTSFFKHNALEIFGKIPLIENNVFRNRNTVNREESNIYLKQPYIVGLRYVFSF